MIVASVLLLIIARAVYKRNQATGRPPMVSYAIPWVGSAIDLGKSPDAFFKRAMYVGTSFARLDVRHEFHVFSAKYGDIFSVKAFGRTVTYVTSPQVREVGFTLS